MKIFKNGDRVIYRDSLKREYRGEVIAVESVGVYTLLLDNDELIGATAGELRLETVA